MREIKFKYWNKKTKKMLEPDGVTNARYITPLRYGIDFIIPLQFTGLKDKNGKEIYEGDIVERKYVDETSLSKAIYLKYVVLWCDLNHKWYFGQPRNRKGVIGGIYSGGLDGQELNKDWKQEIIGNIYENKELIK